MKNKIYDCITFYNENLQVKLRLNILNDYVDYLNITFNKDFKSRSMSDGSRYHKSIKAPLFF